MISSVGVLRHGAGGNGQMYDRSSTRSAFRPGLSWTAALLAATLLAGCDKQPEGQVVAVVNGDEITLQELNAELGNTQLPEGAGKDEIRNQALDNIITRRLLAGVAKDQGIANSPEYIMRRQQLDEALLVQMLAQRTARPMKQPSSQEVNDFVATNPQMFADRAILTLDQIRFPTPANQDFVKALQPTKTMAEVVTALNRLGIRFERGQAQVDTATMPLALYQQITSVGTREPFVVPGPTGVSVNQMISSKPAPLAEGQVTAAATAMIQRRNLAEQLSAMAKSAREEAGIAYQQGFAAPKTAPTTVADKALEAAAGKAPEQ
jgi:EpsD family peptidyl-prolyl cis-trans isomerase